MALYHIKKGVAVIDGGDGDRIVIDETGRKRVIPGVISAAIGLIRDGVGDEDELVAALEDRFPLWRIYHAMNQLVEQGIVEEAGGPPSPSHLFQAKTAIGDLVGYPPLRIRDMTVGVVAIGGVHAEADAVERSLAQSDIIAVKRIKDWRQAPDDIFYVVVSCDYLCPELEAFGRFAYKKRLRWLPVKPAGVIPWMGPFFIPGETGCMECLLDRIRGHRRLEANLIREKGVGEPIRLSVGMTVHSLDVLSGMVTVEMEKLAAGRASRLEGAVFALDFAALELVKHPLTRRPQCPLCGTLRAGHDGKKDIVPEGSLRLQSRMKADWRDGGERICSAAETLRRYSHLVSPVTGLVGRLTTLKDIPPCFGVVTRGDWIVRGETKTMGWGRNSRLSATGLSTGKGRSELQARVSALGEAVERYSTQREGYESHVRASFIELGDIAVHPYELMGFSDRQYKDRETWRKKGATAYVPDPYDVSRPIDWTPAWSLTEDRWRLVPSAFVYYSYPPEGGGDICLGCSNGVAAGNCLEEAVMQGFYELVERDATAMWWYHKLLKPAVDWRGFKSPFADAVDDAMRGMGMRLEILDLTNDLDIPVFSANIFNRDKGCRIRSIGLGCHRDPHIALERALSELGQVWPAAEKDEEHLHFQDSPLSGEPFLRGDTDVLSRGPSDFKSGQNIDFLEDIKETLLLLRSKGFDMLVVDLTRPDIDFPVARVIVPGMVHFRPRFGCRRLFEAPRALRWIDDDVGEDDLNPVPFFL